MNSHVGVIHAGRIIGEAVAKFETPMSALVEEHILLDHFDDNIRHYHLAEDNRTFCNMVVVEADGRKGYKYTCHRCDVVMKRIRQARSDEGARRALERRRAESPDERLARNHGDELRTQIEQYLDTLNDHLPSHGNHSELSLAKEELGAFYKYVKGEDL